MEFVHQNWQQPLLWLINNLAFACTNQLDYVLNGHFSWTHVLHLFSISFFFDLYNDKARARRITWKMIVYFNTSHIYHVKSPLYQVTWTFSMVFMKVYGATNCYEFRIISIGIIQLIFKCNFRKINGLILGCIIRWH